ncbi:MAG: twin transmembrane helix small protein [Methylocella sp.]
MEKASNLVVAIGLAPAAIVLLPGLINLPRRGSPDLSQELKFAVILIIMGVLWFRG